MSSQNKTKIQSISLALPTNPSIHLFFSTAGRVAWMVNCPSACWCSTSTCLLGTTANSSNGSTRNCSWTSGGRGLGRIIASVSVVAAAIATGTRGALQVRARLRRAGATTRATSLSSFTRARAPLLLLLVETCLARSWCRMRCEKERRHGPGRCETCGAD